MIYFLFSVLKRNCDVATANSSPKYLRQVQDKSPKADSDEEEDQFFDYDTSNSISGFSDVDVILYDFLCCSSFRRNS